MNSRTISKKLDRLVLFLSAILGGIVITVCFLTMTTPGRIQIFQAISRVASDKGVSVLGGSLSFGINRATLSDTTVCYSERCSKVEALTITLFPLLSTVDAQNVCLIEPSIPKTSTTVNAQVLANGLRALTSINLPIGRLTLSSPSNCLNLHATVEQSPTALHGTFESPSFGTAEMELNNGVLQLNAHSSVVSIDASLTSDLTLKANVAIPEKDFSVSYLGELDVAHEELRGVVSGSLNGGSSLVFGTTPTLIVRDAEGSFRSATFKVKEFSATYANTETAGRFSGASIKNSDFEVREASGTFRCDLPNRLCNMNEIRIAAVEVPELVKTTDVRFVATYDSRKSCGAARDVNASIWNGRMTLNRIDLCNLSAPSRIEFEDVAISPIVDLLGREDIYAEGRISGGFDLNPYPLAISNGKFSSPHGVLEYSGAAESLPAAAQLALKHLDFSLIAGDFALSEKQRLSSTIRLEGKSPQLNTTRPIHVNVTWEEDFGDILRVLKVTRQLRKEMAEKGLL